VLSNNIRVSNWIIERYNFTRNLRAHWWWGNFSRAQHEERKENDNLSHWSLWKTIGGGERGRRWGGRKMGERLLDSIPYLKHHRRRDIRMGKNGPYELCPSNLRPPLLKTSLLRPTSPVLKHTEYTTKQFNPITTWTYLCSWILPQQEIVVWHQPSKFNLFHRTLIHWRSTRESYS